MAYSFGPQTAAAAMLSAGGRFHQFPGAGLMKNEAFTRIDLGTPGGLFEGFTGMAIARIPTLANSYDFHRSQFRPPLPAPFF